MSDNKNRPPAGRPWIWETLEMKESDALWSLTGGGRRFIDMLVIEHMRHGGKRNGLIVLPQRQCVGRVGHPGLITGYIHNAEEVGFIDCIRGGMRVATRYALTWLPLHDGTPATNRWRDYRNPDLPPWPDRKKGAKTDE